MNLGLLLLPLALDGGGGDSIVSGQLLIEGTVQVQSGKCEGQKV
jgi:hypothetical protein